MTCHHTAIRIGRQSAKVAQRGFRLWDFAFFAISTLLCTTMVQAADGSNLSDAKARYQRERAACVSGKSNQDRTTCLQEAGAALHSAKRGQLEDGQAVYEQNALIRCKALKSEDRQACERRMQGEGISRGSVAEGGIYREYKEVVTLEPAQDSATPDSNASGSSSGGMREGGSGK